MIDDSRKQKRFIAVIRIIGVGGGGNNAVNTMINSGLHNVEFIGVNTDAQALQGCLAGVRIPIGQELTHGLGAGNDPEVGRIAAEASADRLREAIGSADMVFVTAGKGGGTGTGASPVIAGLAREAGALTVGVVTRPFTFEGNRRADQAEQGINLLMEQVDTLVVIPNDRLLEMEEGVPITEAFRLADDVLRQGVQAIAEIITERGLINIDFADVREILSDSGTALIGIGQASDEGRARQAAINAIGSPLLESSIDGARRVLLNISGGQDLALHEVNEVAEVLAQAVDAEANMIFGAVVDERLANSVKVTVLASGFREPTPSHRLVTRSEKRALPESRRSGSRLEPVDVPTPMRKR